jgi:carbamoyltransferase
MRGQGYSISSNSYNRKSGTGLDKDIGMSKASGSPVVLGVYLGHDLGACLLAGGEIIAVIEEERLNRVKHGRPNEVAGLWGQFAGRFGYFPWASVCYCLETGNISIDDLDAIVIGDALWASAAADTIRDVVPIKDRSKIIFVCEPKGAVHHFHHALSAFMASPFDEAAVLIVDGDGNSTEEGYEAETGFLFENRLGDHQVIFKNRYRDTGVPRSGIGWTYEQVTLVLGYGNSKVFLADPGKTMGLAPYGRPRPEFDRRWISYDGFRLDFSGFHEWLRESTYESRILSYREGLAVGPNGLSRYAEDLAFKVQSELELAMLHISRELHQATGAKNLCMAGGVALNCVANGIIARRGPFENIFVQPAANDGGQAIGLAYHGHLLLTSETSPAAGKGMTGAPKVSNGRACIKPIKHAFGGRTYPDQVIHGLLSETGLEFKKFEGDDALVEDAAEELSKRRIIGWFQGGSEIGPRALGHRSILANSDREEIKDQLNSRVKFRESFRPFAPSTLVERVSDVFEISGESPYMLLVAPVREAWKRRVPAITHVDGTARIQTVSADVDPLYYSLISAFERRTSIPLVLNTSFNLKGMPIVETPFDALQCFLFTDMDSLYLGRFKVVRPDPARLYPFKSPQWALIAEHDVSNGSRHVVCRSTESSERFKVDAGPELEKLCELLDGNRSLYDAYLQAYSNKNGNDPTSKIEHVGATIQLLVQRGVMQLRAGSINFGVPGLRLHWWQKSAQRA